MGPGQGFVIENESFMYAYRCVYRDVIENERTTQGMIVLRLIQFARTRNNVDKM